MSKKSKPMADWKHPCDICGQVPSMRITGMCAVCTFGEADAQFELINGEMDEVEGENE